MKISCNKIGLIAAELLARLVSFFVNKILNMNTSMRMRKWKYMIVVWETGSNMS